MKPSTSIAPALVLAIALGACANASPSIAHSYDAIADLSTGRLQLNGNWQPKVIENRCALMQRALAPALVAGAEQLPWRVRIEGQAELTIADHARYEAPAERICLAFFGGPDRDGDGYPEDYAGADPKAGHRLRADGQLVVEWDADITVDTSGQSVDSNFIQLGNTARVGWSDGGRLSNWVEMPVMTGRLHIQLRGDSDDGWPQGKIPAAQSSSPHGSPTRYAIWSEEGLLRADFSSLSRFFRSNPSDYDNVAILHGIYGWGVLNGPIWASGFAVGFQSVGSYVGTTRGGRFENNEYNLVLGNPYRSGMMEPDRNCSRGDEHCLGKLNSGGSHNFSDLLVEGAGRSNVVVFSGIRWMFTNVWIESNRTPAGHSVILGAGTSAKSKMPCGLDTDWNEPCQRPAGARMPGSVRFVGGTIDGDEGSAKWDALLLGPGFDERWSTWISSTLGASRIGGLGLMRKRSFHFHPAAKGRLDLGAAELERNTSIPTYPAVTR